MRRQTQAFLIYFAVQVAVIFIVMAIFRFVESRQIAATLAGILFAGVPVWLMIQEYNRAETQERNWYFGVLQFWLLFALPILGIRLLNWGVPFDQLSFLGVSAPTMHEWSSKSYTVMMLLTLWSALKTKKAGL